MKQQELQFTERTTYNITNDPELLDEQNHITEEALALIDDFYNDLGKGKKSLRKRLERAVKKFPKVPQFKNYLATEYASAGQTGKAEEMSERILEEHPDYLFGKINKAHNDMDKGHTNRVPEVLGEAMELQALYPNRDTFHIDEVSKFYATTVRYFLETEDEQQAKLRLDLMEELDPQAEATQFAREQFMLYKMGKNLEVSRERGEHDAAIERKVESSGYRTSTQTDKAPVFHHPEINLLYKTGFNINEKKFRDLLDLPRKTLIADLEAVLEDTINRFEYFRDEADKSGWDETRHNFSIHALHLLAELGSEQSLPAVLELLRQGDEFINFWYFDSLESFFTSPTAQLATQQIDLLDDFLREPDNNSYARNIAVIALEQMAMWYPELKKEVTGYYEEWLKFLVESYEDEQIFDTELLCFIIWSCINIKAEELLPLIKTLYDQDLVLLSMLGEYPDVERDIKGDFRPEAEPESIFEIYGQLSKNFGYGGGSYVNNMPDISSSSVNPENPASKAFQKMNNIVEPENDPFSDVGRNDPCPCGSGRKFKKCCL